MSVRRSVLPSGLRIVTEEVPSVRSAAIGIWVNVGSRDETPAVAGASHFLEHLLFKGTKRRNALEISSSIESVGGEMNAFTSKEYTCFYARVIDTDLPMAIDVVSDLITSSVVTALDVDAERKVVLEEIAMRDDDPSDLVHDLYAETYYGDTPLGRPILGTIDSINNMWVQVGMTLQGLGVGEKFGHQIDLNDEGDVLVVGIPFRGPSLKGAVQVFRRDSTNNWVQQGSTLDRGLGYIQFGNTVSMNSEGNMFVAGSWGSANAYKAYVYKWNNTTLNWSQFGPIINPAASWREWCYDVEMDSSGYIIAVSSIFDEEARVYQYNSGSNTWGLIPSNISGRVSGDDFGGCLDLSGDGQRLIVGAPTDGLHFIEGGNVAVFSDYCSNMTKFSLSDCDSVILPNGMSVKTSGFHYDTLVNVRGCDSILRYSLLIKQPSSAIQYDTSCVSFTSNSGVLYTQSGVFQEHFTNQVGCDSTLYLHINIPYLDTSIYLNAPYLVSAAQNVTYQWYDCNAQAVILGETNVNFLPSNNGSYAVIIEKDGCSDTSNCFNLVNFGQIELTENVIVYPNPVSETIRIQYEGEIQTELVNSIGQKVLSTNKKEFDVFHLQRGLYTVVLVTGNGSVHVRKLVIK